MYLKGIIQLLLYGLLHYIVVKLIRLSKVHTQAQLEKKKFIFVVKFGQLQ